MAILQPLPDLWPPDDTEESVVGTSLHQLTIRTLCSGINSLSGLHRSPDQPRPWHAVSQVNLVGCRRPDGSAYTTLPDVFVFPHAVDDTLPSISIAEEAPPVLIIEVLSPSTVDADLDLERGKGYSYADAGIREYLTVDPMGQWLPEGMRGWRLEGGVYVPWEPNEQGRWTSREVEVAFGMEGGAPEGTATVYSWQGWAHPPEDDIALEITQRDTELAERDAEIERLRLLLRARGYEDG